MLNFIKNFRNDEDGAVTVDFVVLTAAIVLLGLAVGAAIQSGARGLANDIKSELENVEVAP
jgi:Flp pilus assembly pilin Flp